MCSPGLLLWSIPSWWIGLLSWIVLILSQFTRFIVYWLTKNPHFSRVFQQNLQRNCGQLCKSWVKLCLCMTMWLWVAFALQYMFLFQVPKVPEFLLSMSDYSAIRNTFTGAQQVSHFKWGWASFFYPKKCTGSALSLVLLSSVLLTSWLLQGVRNRASFPPEVVEAYKYTFSQPGALTAPINYYRCLHEARDDMKPYLNRKINMPTMSIWVGCSCRDHLQQVVSMCFALLYIGRLR